MEVETDQNGYFSSYNDVEVHKIMLEDIPRTEAYKRAILDNKEYFQDKVVMDVGCGTGILSIFCAQAGAKKVFAVEASNLAHLAKEIVKENKYADVIEILHSKVEDVTLPNDTKVDAIVSEWMGFYLLHEGMLESVLVARDKFLKQGGEMFPETAAIYCAPCSVPSMYDKWNNIYGVSMTSFAKYLRETKCNKPEITDVQNSDLLADEEVLSWINLREDQVSDLNKYNLTFVKDLSGKGDNRVILSTAPSCPSTHWKQTLIILPQDLDVEEGEPIAFQLDMTRDAQSCRRYNLQVTMLDPEEIDHPHPCSCHMTKCILIKTVLEKQFSNMDEVVLEDDVIDDD